MRSGGGIFVRGGERGMWNERERCEALLYRQGKVSVGVDQKVFPQGRGGNFRPPVEGALHKG